MVERSSSLLVDNEHSNCDYDSCVTTGLDQVDGRAKLIKRTITGQIRICQLLPIQRELYLHLVRAHHLDDVDLMDLAFKNSGCSLGDLLEVFLTIVDVEAGNRRLVSHMQDLIKLHRGRRLDGLIDMYFSLDDKEREGEEDLYLLALLSTDLSVKMRLGTYEGNGSESELLKRCFVYALERLYKLHASINNEEALVYLKRMISLGMPLEKVNARLVTAIKTPRFFEQYFDLVFDLMWKGEIDSGYRSGVGTVVAALAYKGTEQMRQKLIKLDREHVYTERLIALSKTTNVDAVTDNEIYDLMLEEDFEAKDNDESVNYKIRNDLRRFIIEEGILGKRAYYLGLARLFQNRG